MVIKRIDRASSDLRALEASIQRWVNTTERRLTRLETLADAARTD
jgi:hypothetical protein